MNKLMNEWRKFLNEVWYNDAEETLEKYPEQEEEIDFLSNNSPYKEKYIGKFAQWAKQGEDPDEIVALAKHFKNNRQSMKDRGLEKLDLMQYSSADELESVIEKYGKKSNRQKEKEVKENDTIEVYSDEEFLAVVPLSEKSSCKYGKGTKWCTAASEARNAFERYFNKMGITLVYIINKNSQEKVALTYYDYTDDETPQEIFDTQDRRIQLKDVKEFLGDKSNKILSKSNKIAKKIGDKKWEEKEQKVLNGEANKKMKQSVAANTNNPETLKKLAKDENRIVKGEVAENPNTPPETLKKLAKDESRHIRSEIALNPNTPKPALEKLSKDEREAVIVNVASNPELPISILKRLSNNESWRVRRKIIKNPKTPKQILEKYSEDESPFVREQLALSPKASKSALKKLAKDERWQTKRSVAANLNTPRPALGKLSGEEHWKIRKRVALNPNTPISTLKKLAKDENKRVRGKLASNENTPIPILKDLSREEVYWIKKDAEKALEDKNINESQIILRIN